MSERGELEWAAEFKTWGEINQLWRPGRRSESRGTSEQELDYWVDPYTSQAEGMLALAVSDSDPSFCPLRFQGQWEDAETGFYYNRFRYYEPQSGSYVSQDPLGMVGGLSIFSYTQTPTKITDPLGLYGVYVFQVLPGAKRNAGRCYVGRGDPSRFDQSRKERSGFRRADCARKHTKGQHYNTDAAAAAAAAAANVNPLEFGKLVEHVLIGGQSGYDAVGRADWANARLDGQAAWGRASQAQQSSAMAEAQRVQTRALVGSGCS